jgi:hypothetical protein
MSEIRCNEGIITGDMTHVAHNDKGEVVGEERQDRMKVRQMQNRHMDSLNCWWNA